MCPPATGPAARLVASREAHALDSCLWHGKTTLKGDSDAQNCSTTYLGTLRPHGLPQALPWAEGIAVGGL